MIEEHVIHRVLGAMRFVDGNTGYPLSIPLIVEAEGVKLRRNRSGYYVIWSVPALEAHTEAFLQPPEDPPLGDVDLEVTVEDPQGQYLPRRTTIQLPRDPDPQNVDQANSLFRTIDVDLYPSPVGKTAPGWAVIRATVTTENGGDRLPGALIRVLPTGETEPMARGLSDWRGRVLGEAMVVVPGIPVTTWGDGNGDNGDGDGDGDEVLLTKIPATLQVVYDPAFQPEEGQLPDPDDLEARHETLPSASQDVQLSSGETLAITLTVPLL